MTWPAAVTLFLLACLVVFVVANMRPLSGRQLQALANKRRTRAIRNCYRLADARIEPDLAFKRDMRSGGSFYEACEELSRLPHVVASHLKWKKHEWIVVGFARDRTVDLMWLNKGGAGCVSPAVPFQELARLATERRATTLLIFHNHRSRFRGRRGVFGIIPSRGDMQTTEAWGEQLVASGIALLAFVCCRGRPHAFKVKCPDCLLPLSEFVNGATADNGRSRLRNLAMNWERIFGASGSPVSPLGDF